MIFRLFPLVPRGLDCGLVKHERRKCKSYDEHVMGQRNKCPSPSLFLLARFSVMLVLS